MNASGLLAHLAQWKLLREDQVPDPRGLYDTEHPQTLLRLCDAGALEGGLSVALDVRPDELVGPLCLRVGGGARGLKIADVREGPPLVLEVELAGRARSWEVHGLEDLVYFMNDAFASDPRALAIAVLGEWEEMWQLWCVPKTRVGELLEQRWFLPLNPNQLQRQ